MEIKKLKPDFSVCKVADYSLVNLDAEYCFIGKTDEEKSEFVQSLQIMLRLRNRPSVPMSTYNPTYPRASGPCLNP